MTKNLLANTDGRAIARTEAKAGGLTRDPLRPFCAGWTIGARSHHERLMSLSGHHGDRRRVRRPSPAEAATGMWLIADVTWVARTAAL
jgi:hypothetical protein